MCIKTKSGLSENNINNNSPEQTEVKYLKILQFCHIYQDGEIGLEDKKHLKTTPK